MNRSYFDGSVLGYLGWSLLTWLLTTVTFGIAFPWAYVLMVNWRVQHTVIEGRRLDFDGTAMQFFGNWLKWLLLIIITFGIYGLWVVVELKKWQTKHIFFADEQ